jgi:hypothetical protein
VREGRREGRGHERRDELLVVNVGERRTSLLLLPLRGLVEWRSRRFGRRNGAT